MKNKRILIISLIVALTVLLLVYFFLNLSDSKKYMWFETYDGDSDQPYGTLFARKLLESYRPGGEFIYNQKKSIHNLLDSVDFPKGTDYVFIGPNDYLDENDVNTLAKFIERGNDAFIASLTPPEELIRLIYKGTCPQVSYVSYKEDFVNLNFYHAYLKTKNGYLYTFRFAGVDCPYYWYSLDKSVLCDPYDSLVPLGYQQGGLVNFFKIPHGKGSLYLHTNPLAFTNFFLTQTDKVEYASGVFTHLQGENIIWDEYSKMPFIQSKNAYDTPLYFILEQPALKYAWWMILGAVMLFVLFAAKRKQKVIPVIEPKSNTSLEYVTMISSLHYQNGDHLDMARKKMKYFLYFIRARYGIHTSTFTLAHVPILSEKSKVKEEDLQHIFYRWNVIDKFGRSGIEDFRLTDLYHAIDSFYRNCK